MLEKLSETFGKPSLGSLTETPVAIKIKAEPWMADFVKERHTQEEWDWFFWYQTASPFKRFLSGLLGVVLAVFEPKEPFSRK